MSSTSPSTTPPVRRRSLFRFGMRTVFVLITLAALAALWARSEMAKEEAREQLIASMQNEANRLSLDPKAQASSRRRLAAWLRGKPLAPAVTRASINKVDDPAALRELVETFPEVGLWLQFDASNVTPKLLDALAEAKKVELLNLSSSAFDTSDESLSRLAKIRPTQNGICFSAEHLDDDLLRRVAAAKIKLGWIWDLNYEDLHGWRSVTNEGLRTAATFPRLTTIVANRSADDEGVAAFKDHPTVNDVELIGPGYTDASVETLVTLRRMSSLKLFDTQLTDSGVAKAIEKSSLDTLMLKGANIGEKTIAAIAGMTSLRDIELHDVPLSPELAAAIAKHPLEDLHLSGDYTDADLIHLAPVAPRLQGIFLHTPHVTDEGLKWLASAGTLNNLSLTDTQATAATMKLISSPHISLNLGGPNINAEVIAEAHRKLKVGWVSLYGQTIDDSVLVALEPTYQRLMLAGTRTTAAGLKSLKTAQGKKISIRVFAPDDREPPLTAQEIEDIKQATGGLVEVKINIVSPQRFELMLPKSSRNEAAEEASP